MRNKVRTSRDKASNNFLAYFKEYPKRHAADMKNRCYNSYVRVCLLFKEYRKGKETSFEMINVRICNGFCDYLLSYDSEHAKSGKLCSGTVSRYYSVFKAVLHHAFVEGHLTTDIGRKIKNIPMPKPVRETLNSKEIEKLALTTCGQDVVKRAAMFCLLTGLRHVDIVNLTWKEIVDDVSGKNIVYARKQPGRPDYVPLSSQAFDLCGTRRLPYNLVFKDLPDSTTCNRILVRWLEKAGINRHITFRAFRHTFAVRLLQNGEHLNIVQTLLGHTRISTTEHYMQMVNRNKIKAANSIKI